MSWRRAWSVKEDLKRQERHYREVCYDAGLKGRPCPFKHVVCQKSWQRGQERRRDLLLNDLDEDDAA